MSATTAPRTTSNGFTPADGHLYYRDLFLDFFSAKERECKRIASDSLVPENDASLLFTGAGMNQFKDDFTGVLRHGTRRATTVQKCVRMPDLENVGKTARHHTFFEMLGFFSFGDFFKQQAIRWIWEFYTSADWCGLDKGKLRVSVYKDDDEAYELWKTLEPSLHEKGWIYRLGEYDNFWPAGSPTEGPNGVCGPCSEIFYDLGERLNKPELKGTDTPETNGDRFMELGNIVFTQFMRSGPIPGEGKLDPLPQKNIDFGGGLERLMLVKEGANATLDTSLFMPMRHAMRELAMADAKQRQQRGEELSDYQKGVLEEELNFSAPGGARKSRPFFNADLEREKRIADHLRASVFIIADGVTPSNEKQGYVLRRILRRAYRDGVKMGFSEPYLYKLAPVLIDSYGRSPDYANLIDAKSLIVEMIRREESDFDRVLVKGMEKLGHEMKLLDQRNTQTLTGATAFDLHSTHGLPIDVTRDVLHENGFRVDEEGFERAFAEFREKSRKNAAFSGEVFDSGWLSKTKRIAKPTAFVGYENLTCDARVMTLTHEEREVGSIEAGQQATIILNTTTFYGESGGQVGDTGTLTGPEGVFEVTDTQKIAGYHLHIGTMRSGRLESGQTVSASVDGERRRAIMSNHSATHLMHSALRQVLGDHVHQKGSLVGPDYLRFDFSHPQRVTLEELEAIERLVDQWVQADGEVSTTLTTPDAARDAGALMFFGEKYGSEVRMLTMADPAHNHKSSCELCGGTHVSRTGEIGAFRIVSESSVSSGVRRIEAITGPAAVDLTLKEHHTLVDLSGLLKVPSDQILSRVEQLLKDLKEAKSAKPAQGAVNAGSLTDKAEQIGNIRAIVQRISGAGMNDLLTTKDALMQDQGLDATLLAGDADGKVSLVLALSQRVVDAGGDAGGLLREIAAVAGGKGGGKKHLAQAGAKEVEKIDEALAKGREVLASLK